ncbi:DoxX family protein [Hyphomonas johnsonii]|uniref:DoxX family protein n=1 Tax=Hyphomonas johnsonii MHS-2 TaxID=1280950 RepID=A0A059FS88_9PROT|nr:DoxX family protein [Hyphomonas johnsonii]KCZ93477.1 DoxX family protein [Hyphomonas johnsonii MHS-2]
MKIRTTLISGYTWFTQKADLLEPFALLAARLAVARVFLMSGFTKWNGFLSFNPDKYDLFLYEFFCPEEKRAGALVLCTDQVEGTYAPTMQWIVERFANMAGIMEILLPILLIFGLTSRFAAAGLLTMTLVIERLVFPDADSWWGSHVWWAALLFVILARGPGLFSVDRLIKLERPGV